MKAAVSPQDISKLKVGQEVQMRVSACPYPDYGTLQGRVTQIAQDTSKPPSQSENDSQVQKATAFYEVAIAPNSNTFGRQEHQCSLQLGMESQADIISRQETMLQFILRKARLTSNL
jgi:HlyD family secretion protein